MNESQRQHTLDVAKAIERNACLYRQEVYTHTNGIPGCIAAWSVAVSSHGKVDLRLAEAGIERVAGVNLGLTQKEQRVMFDVDPYHGEEPATAAEAIEMLRHFAATGEVRWPKRS